MCVRKGDTEYDEKKLKKNKTAVVFVDDMEKLTPQYLNELEVIYQPGTRADGVERHVEPG